MVLDLRELFQGATRDEEQRDLRQFLDLIEASQRLTYHKPDLLGHLLILTDTPSHQMAVKNLIARPDEYGIALAQIENRPYFTVVSTDKHIDVKLAAKLADMPLADFQALNPSHNRPVIRADVAQPILVPTDRAETFQANLEAHGATQAAAGTAPGRSTT